MPTTRHAEFAAMLRRLRTQAGLTLRRVEQLSQQIPRPDGDPLSHAYVAALESGRPVRPTIGKILSLSAIYRVQVSELIDAAPEELATRLRAQLAERRRGDAAIVSLLPAPPGPADAAYEAFGQDISSRCVMALIPYNEDATWRRSIPRIIFRLTMPALLAERPRFNARRFWAHGAARLRLKSLAPDSDPRHVWDGIVRWFLDTMVQADVWRSRAAAAIRVWAMVTTGQTVSCVFRDPALHARYSVHLVPITLAGNIRSAQLAAILGRYAPRRLALPPPPSVADVVRDYLHLRLSRDVPNPVERIAFVGRFMADLSKEVPFLVEGDPDPEIRQAAIRLIRQSLAD